MIKNRYLFIINAFFTLVCAYFAFFSPINYSNPVFAESEKLSSAKAMATIEKTSGRVLYCEKENEKLPMASTTKIITAIYVIENNNDLNKLISIPKEAVGIEGTSIGLKEGEHLTIKELLYGLMLRSGNDSAVALAIATSGSEEKFVCDVNDFLKQKGFLNTHLKNPHGLPDEEHYTTALDLANITAYAMQNPIFCEIVSTKEKAISNELKTKTSRNLINKNKLLTNFEFADGVKTGYTRKAGRCFVGSATKYGMSVICVLLNCAPMFEDCEKLLNMAFDEYKLYKIMGQGDKLGEIQIEKGYEDKLEVLTPCDFYYPLKTSELGGVKVEVDIPKKLFAPVHFNEPIASIKISLANQLIFSEKIYSIKDIKNNSFTAEFKRIVEKM